MTVWSFSSEFDLEEFIWASLEPLLNLRPLARQYSTGGQICDILALAPGGQLVILELKNVEDRYVVLQLTRYCASLSQEQPFGDRVDYSLPIRLIAIAPAFHAHNYVDRDHSRLEFEFWRFSVGRAGDSFQFQLSDLGSTEVAEIEIPEKFHTVLQSAVEDAPPPDAVPDPGGRVRSANLHVRVGLPNGGVYHTGLPPVPIRWVLVR